MMDYEQMSQMDSRRDPAAHTSRFDRTGSADSPDPRPATDPTQRSTVRWPTVPHRQTRGGRRRASVRGSNAAAASRRSASARLTRPADRTRAGAASPSPAAAFRSTARSRGRSSPGSLPPAGAFRSKSGSVPVRTSAVGTGWVAIPSAAPRPYRPQTRMRFPHCVPSSERTCKSAVPCPRAHPPAVQQKRIGARL